MLVEVAYMKGLELAAAIGDPGTDVFAQKAQSNVREVIVVKASSRTTAKKTRFPGSVFTTFAVKINGHPRLVQKCRVVLQRLVR